MSESAESAETAVEISEAESQVVSPPADKLRVAVEGCVSCSLCYPVVTKCARAMEPCMLSTLLLRLHARPKDGMELTS